MSKLRALDLFCCAGGVTKGLQNAGFHVVGVDIKPQPRYCGDEFYQADALKPPVDPRDFDFVWASPPCQGHTSLKHMWNAKKHVDLIPETRALLKSKASVWCMENVPGAPLKNGLSLCGTMFELGAGDAELRRHRNFELSWHLPLFGLPVCRHRRKPRVIGVYGGHGRDRRRTVNTHDYSTEMRREAMGIDWMTGAELSQAIPPSYAEYIGRAAIAHINSLRAEAA
jgi:DNA (cytosine-5)-methyltransferase 1